MGWDWMTVTALVIAITQYRDSVLATRVSAVCLEHDCSEQGDIVSLTDLLEKKYLMRSPFTASRYHSVSFRYRPLVFWWVLRRKPRQSLRDISSLLLFVLPRFSFSSPTDRWPKLKSVPRFRSSFHFKSLSPFVMSNIGLMWVSYSYICVWYCVGTYLDIQHLFFV